MRRENNTIKDTKSGLESRNRLHVIHAPVVSFGCLARSLILTLEVFFLEAIAAVFIE